MGKFGRVSGESNPGDIKTPTYMAFELDPLRRTATIMLGNLVDGKPHLRVASSFTANTDNGEEGQ